MTILQCMLSHVCVDGIGIQCCLFLQGQVPLQKVDSYSRSANISQHDLYVAYGTASPSYMHLINTY